MSYTTVYARRLRTQATEAERHLWRHLRSCQICGVKFRRQVPIGRYIVDFASFDARLVIEIDGGQHAGDVAHSRDVARDRWLQAQGLVVLRFWNNEVLSNTAGVLSAIAAQVQRCRP